MNESNKNAALIRNLTLFFGGKYVFVEEGLAKLAPVIGMDSSNLLFSAKDDADDEFEGFLDF